MLMISKTKKSKDIAANAKNIISTPTSDILTCHQQVAHQWVTTAWSTNIKQWSPISTRYQVTFKYPVPSKVLSTSKVPSTINENSGYPVREPINQHTITFKL